MRWFAAVLGIGFVTLAAKADPPVVTAAPPVIVITAPPVVTTEVIRDCKMKITNFNLLIPPPQIIPGKPFDPSKPFDPKAAQDPTLITLESRDWKCGRCFTDGHGWRWMLMDGPPYGEKPTTVRGWLSIGPNGVQHFLSENGRLYRRQLF